MKAVSIILVIFLIAGCSLKNGAIYGAHQRYVEGKYEEAIAKSLLAAGKYEFTDDESAQLYYIIAQSYEKLGDLGKANSMYTFIIDKYPETKYAYLSKAAIE